MLKLLLLPFRVIFAVLRAIFFPWYLRWIFSLPWVIYLAGAVWVGSLAYGTYEDYLFERLEADIQVRQGAPDVVASSAWTNDSANAGDEVNVQALYFPVLPDAMITNNGFERGFLALADEQGREVKVVLVVPLGEIDLLRRQLTRQGSGDQVAVTINGTLNRNFNWREMIDNRMSVLGLPAADDFIVIEPFLEPRAQALMSGADSTFGEMTLLGGLAAVLAVLGLGKLATGLGERRTAAATQSQLSAREVQAKRPQKQPTQQIVPTNNGQNVSPWGSFTPQPRSGQSLGLPQPNQVVKTQTPVSGRGSPMAQTAAAKGTAPAKSADVPVQPRFKSVFPGGGSSFRFKSADEIIKQSFGTLSSLKPSKRGE